VCSNSSPIELHALLSPDPFDLDLLRREALFVKQRLGNVGPLQDSNSDFSRGLSRMEEDGRRAKENGIFLWATGRDDFDYRTSADSAEKWSQRMPWGDMKPGIAYPPVRNLLLAVESRQAAALRNVGERQPSPAENSKRTKSSTNMAHILIFTPIRGNIVYSPPGQLKVAMEPNDCMFEWAIKKAHTKLTKYLKGDAANENNLVVKEDALGEFIREIISSNSVYSYEVMYLSLRALRNSSERVIEKILFTSKSPETESGCYRIFNVWMNEVKRNLEQRRSTSQGTKLASEMSQHGLDPTEERVAIEIMLLIGKQCCKKMERFRIGIEQLVDQVANLNSTSERLILACNLAKTHLCGINSRGKVCDSSSSQSNRIFSQAIPRKGGAIRKGIIDTPSYAKHHLANQNNLQGQHIRDAQNKEETDREKLERLLRENEFLWENQRRWDRGDCPLSNESSSKRQQVATAGASLADDLSSGGSRHFDARDINTTEHRPTGGENSLHCYGTPLIKSESPLSVTTTGDQAQFPKRAKLQSSAAGITSTRGRDSTVSRQSMWRRSDKNKQSRRWGTIKSRSNSGWKVKSSKRSGSSGWGSPGTTNKVGGLP